jgi:hypothetical protein
MNKIKILFVVLGLCLLYSCTSSPIPSIEIGQKQDAALDYLVNNIILHNEWDNLEDKIEKARTDDHITLKNCEYNGVVFHKIRVYFTTGIVRKIEIEIPKEKHEIIMNAMKDKYGNPTIEKIKGYFSYEDMVIFSSDKEECIVREIGDNYEFIIANNFDQYKLKNN